MSIGRAGGPGGCRGGEGVPRSMQEAAAGRAGVRVERPSAEELKALGVDGWSSWSCERRTFDWSYDEEETCWIREGKARVSAGGETVEFGAGDLVTFPKGLACTWEVLEPVRKVYAFDVRR